MHFRKRSKGAADNVVRDLGRTVAQMDHATSGVGTHHTEGVTTKPDPRRDDTITIKTSLESNTEYSIL